MYLAGIHYLSLTQALRHFGLRLYLHTFLSFPLLSNRIILHYVLYLSVDQIAADLNKRTLITKDKAGRDCTYYEKEKNNHLFAHLKELYIHTIIRSRVTGSLKPSLLNAEYSEAIVFWFNTMVT